MPYAEVLRPARRRKDDLPDRDATKLSFCCRLARQDVLAEEIAAELVETSAPTQQRHDAAARSTASQALASELRTKAGS